MSLKLSWVGRAYQSPLGIGNISVSVLVLDFNTHHIKFAVMTPALFAVSHIYYAVNEITTAASD